MHLECEIQLAPRTSSYLMAAKLQDVIMSVMNGWS